MADESVIKFLLVKLTEFLIEKGQQLTVRDETECISHELQYMTTFLRVADAREESDPVLDLLVKRVRDVAFEIEDALDEFNLSLSQNQEYYTSSPSIVRKIYSLFGTGRARYRIASKIQGVKSRVISISATHRRYCNNNNIVAQASSSNNILPLKRRRDTFESQEPDLVFFEKRKKLVIEQLFDRNSEREVVSVVGMGGMGKSTLARKVFSDPDVKKHFEFRAWITVSQSFKIEYLLKDMMKQLFRTLRKALPQGIDSMDYDQLILEIHEFLHQRKYLIVLDDIWHVNAWEDDFRHALPSNHCGSRVLITTRNKVVASLCCSNIFNLNPLTANESWTLFCKKIFQKTSCPRHLKKVSEKILAKCEGLPLAISAISGVLATKDKSRIDEWDIVSRSLGANLEDIGKVKSILSLSYNDLPYYLKPCLLYLSIFPRHPIECKRLIRLWIAEGFVKEIEGMTLEEVAQGYINELLQRNLVQVVESRTDGQIQTCRIHDLLRERITSRSKNQDFVAVVKESSMLLPEQVRRLSIHNTTQQHIISIVSRRLRSLFMFWGVDSLSESPILKLSSHGLRLLTILDLQGAPLKEFPKEVVNLFLLKYLSLRNTKVKSVPNSIGNLQNLQTLDLKHSFVSELPVDIGKLRKLCYLLVYRYTMEYDRQSRTKYGFKAGMIDIGNLQSLQKLCFIEAKQGIHILTQLGELTQLRRLGVVKLKKEDGQALCYSIQKMRDLRALSITSIDEDEIMDIHYLSSPPPFIQRIYLTGHLEELPKWISSLHCLVKLVLRKSRLCNDPLVATQHLPNLVHLEFIEVYDGDTLRFKRGGFQRLKVLGLNNLDGLKSVTIQKGTMQCLQHLTIQSCKLLQKVPFGIKYLNELKLLEFFDMPNGFITRIRPEIGDDFQKVKKIPEVYFTYQINGSREVYSLENFKKVTRPGPYWKP